MIQHYKKISFWLCVVFLVNLIIYVGIRAEEIVEVPYGAVEFISLPASPQSISDAYISRPDIPDLVLQYEQPLMSLVVYPYTPDRMIHIPLPQTVRQLTWVYTRGIYTFFAALSADSRSVQLLQYNSQSLTVEIIDRRSFETPVILMKTADIYGNGQNELLFLSENETGIGILSLNGDQLTNELTYIFGDVIISDFELVDVNKDGIPDIFIFDPIKNVLQLHYNFGSLMFSLGYAIEAPSQIKTFHAVPLGKDHIIDLVISFPQREEVWIYLGDGFGRYTVSHKIKTSSAITKIVSSDIFQRGLNDLLFLDNYTSKLIVYKNRDAETFTQSGMFLPADEVIDIYISQVNKNLYILDGSRNQLISFIRSSKLVQTQSVKLAIPSQPKDVVVTEGVNGIESEIYTLSPEASAISIYKITGGTEISHWMISIPESLKKLYAYPIAPKRTKILGLGDTADFILVFSADWDSNNAKIYSIPVLRDSEIIYIDLSPLSMFRFVTVRHSSAGEGTTLSLFEQVEKDEYIERIITIPPHYRVYDFKVVDFYDNGYLDFMYIYKNEISGKLFFASAISDSQYVFKEFSSQIPFEPEMQIVKALILEKDRINISELHLSAYFQFTGNIEKLLKVTGRADGVIEILEKRFLEQGITIPLTDKTGWNTYQKDFAFYLTSEEIKSISTFVTGEMEIKGYIPSRNGKWYAVAASKEEPILHLLSFKIP